MDDDGCGEIAGSSEAAEAAVVPPPLPPPAEAKVECGWELEMVDEGGAEIEEAAVAEVMKLLEREITMPPEAAEGGSYYQTPGFVTINGNEEMCGPSFSDHSSTVMASVDTRGLVGGGGAASYYFDGVPPGVPQVPGAAVVPPAPAPLVWGEEDEEWLDRMIGGGGGAGLL